MGVPVRCYKMKRGGGRCGKRMSIRRRSDAPDTRCPRCRRIGMVIDAYRIKGRRHPNKDNPPRCDCNGPKAKEDDKIQYHQGEPIVRGPHRLGQKGCIHWLPF